MLQTTKKAENKRQRTRPLQRAVSLNLLVSLRSRLRLIVSSIVEVKGDAMSDGRVFILERIAMTLNIVGLGMTEPPKIVVSEKLFVVIDLLLGFH